MYRPSIAHTEQNFLFIASLALNDWLVDYSTNQLIIPLWIFEVLGFLFPLVGWFIPSSTKNPTKISSKVKSTYTEFYSHP